MSALAHPVPVPDSLAEALRAAFRELTAAVAGTDRVRVARASAHLAARAQEAEHPLVVNAVNKLGPAPTEAQLASLGWEIERALSQRPSTRLLPPTLTTGRVIVLDPDPDSRAALSAQVRAQLVAASEARTIDEAVTLLAEGRVDAVLVDSAVDGELSRVARAGVPLAILGAEGSTERRAAAIAAGATLYLERPLSPEALGLALRQLLDARSTAPAKILLVDDDESFLGAMAKLLRTEGFAVHTLSNPWHVLDLLEEHRPDLVVLDASMPDASGYDLCRILRASPTWQDLPVVFLTSRTDAESRVAAFRAGADDFMTKTTDPDELIARIHARVERSRQLRSRGERDALTGLYRRSTFMSALSTLLNHARRRARPLALAVLDLDRFKDVNDRYGHLAGDRVLVAIGKLISSRFRAEDVRGRWGGEELVIAFPEEEGSAIAPAIQRLLEDLRAIPFGEGEPFFVSFSAGVATYPFDGKTPAELFGAADRRLYIAKKLGRARVVSEG